MEMKHGTLEQWAAYVRHELPDGESAELEKHLESCEVCMELYVQSVELAMGSYPMLLNEIALADSVMKTIHEGSYVKHAACLAEAEGASATRKWLRPVTWTRHPLFHYSVAAAITMILLGSGLFQSLLPVEGQADPFSSEPAQGEPLKRQPSVSQQLLDQTIVMLDSIQHKQERGGIR
jgi:anti-sigma factor RsiW